MYSQIKAEFRHTKIVVDETGMHLTRDDGEETPPAPSQEKAQRARLAVAAAICALHGDGKEYVTKDHLLIIQAAAEGILREAFAALETPE